MPRREPVVDLAKIDFPTDKLTVKRLRQFDPSLFDRMGERGPSRWARDYRTPFEALLLGERDFASRAFNAAMGRPSDWDPDSTCNVDEEMHMDELARKLLRSAYVDLGLATGEHHAEQLLRSVEQAAAEQAKAYAPRSRS